MTTLIDFRTVAESLLVQANQLTQQSYWVRHYAAVLCDEGGSAAANLLVAESLIGQAIQNIQETRVAILGVADAALPSPQHSGDSVFTTGDVAKICKVAPRTVSKWCDSSRLKCYRIPGSQERRIPASYLRKFLREHGMEAYMSDPRLAVAQIGGYSNVEGGCNV